LLESKNQDFRHKQLLYSIRSMNNQSTAFKKNQIHPRNNNDAAKNYTLSFDYINPHYNFE